MARVTVEDCLEHIPNHFDLCLVASKRARQLARGANSQVPWGDHKSTVLALREIGGGFVNTKILQEDDPPFMKPAELEITLPDLDKEV